MSDRPACSSKGSWSKGPDSAQPSAVSRPESDFFKPLIVAGRWLVPGDGRAIVIPRETAEKNNIQVNDIIILDIGASGRDEWQVVGLYEPVFVGGFAADTLYAPLDSLFQITKTYNKSGLVQVRTTAHDLAFAQEVTKNLKETFEKHNMDVAGSQVQLDQRATNEWQFSLVTSMLLALSIIVAIVGAIALMGALSIGVIERTKEIGVLRAVGARSPVIMGIFVTGRHSAGSAQLADCRTNFPAGQPGRCQGHGDHYVRRDSGLPVQLGRSLRLACNCTGDFDPGFHHACTRGNPYQRTGQSGVRIMKRPPKGGLCFL